MLSRLFARLTADPGRGAALFEALVREAREPQWYIEGGVADDVDGRFAILSTVIALAIVRLEAGGAEAQAASVALSERFIEAMDSEHREMGIGDPAIGKTVRKLVGSLAGRVELWRKAVPLPDWSDAARTTVYRGAPVSSKALGHTEAQLRHLWQRLGAADDPALARGRIG